MTRIPWCQAFAVLLVIACGCEDSSPPTAVNNGGARSLPAPVQPVDNVVVLLSQPLNAPYSSSDGDSWLLSGYDLEYLGAWYFVDHPDAYDPWLIKP